MLSKPLNLILKSSFEFLLALVAAIVILAACQLVAYGSDDTNWLAGAVQSEAYSQPFEAQCAIAAIVWLEANSRDMSVEGLVKHTNFLSGWKAGGWHVYQYTHPQEWAIRIAEYAQGGLCNSYGAKHFDGRYGIPVYADESGSQNLAETRISRTGFILACLPTTRWSNRVKLVAQIGGTCFYE